MGTLPLPAASQALLEWIVLSGGPVSITGTASQCPTLLPGGVYAGTDFTGTIQGNVVSTSSPNGGVDLDLHVYKWNAGVLDCVRSPDGGVSITSSRGATIQMGVGAGSSAA